MVPVGSSRDSYSVGRSEGVLVPVGSCGRRPKGTGASEGYSTIRLFWRALGFLRVINRYCDKLVYLFLQAIHHHIK